MPKGCRRDVGRPGQEVGLGHVVGLGHAWPKLARKGHGSWPERALWETAREGQLIQFIGVSGLGQFLQLFLGLGDVSFLGRPFREPT